MGSDRMRCSKVMYTNESVSHYIQMGWEEQVNGGAIYIVVSCHSLAEYINMWRVCNGHNTTVSSSHLVWIFVRYSGASFWLYSSLHSNFLLSFIGVSTFSVYIKIRVLTVAVQIWAGQVVNLCRPFLFSLASFVVGSFCLKEWRQ